MVQLRRVRSSVIRACSANNEFLSSVSSRSLLGLRGLRAPFKMPRLPSTICNRSWIHLRRRRNSALVTLDAKESGGGYMMGPVGNRLTDGTARRCGATHFQQNDLCPDCLRSMQLSRMLPNSRDSVFECGLCRVFVMEAARANGQ